MHSSHIKALEDVMPNLDRSVFDHETVFIGGGEFDSSTILALKLAAKYMLAAHRDYCERVYGPQLADNGGQS